MYPYEVSQSHPADLPDTRSAHSTCGSDDRRIGATGSEEPTRRQYRAGGLRKKVSMAASLQRVTIRATLTRIRSSRRQTICLEVAGRIMQVVSYYTEQDIQRGQPASGSISMRSAVSGGIRFCQPLDQSQMNSHQSGHDTMARYHPPQSGEDAHTCLSFHPAIIPPAPWMSGKAVLRAADHAQSYNQRLLADHVDTSAPSHPNEQQVSGASRGAGQTVGARPAITPLQTFPPSTSRYDFTPYPQLVGSDAPFFEDPGSLLVQPILPMQNSLGNGRSSFSHVTYPAESVDWSDVPPVQPSAQVSPQWAVEYEPMETEAVPDHHRFPEPPRAGSQPSDLDRNSHSWRRQAVPHPDSGNCAARESVPPLPVVIMAQLMELPRQN